MDYILDSELMNKLVREVLKSRCYHYSDDPIVDVLEQYPDLACENISIENCSGQKLEHSDVCVLFMHGLGSMRLEGLNILKNMPKQFSLCLFDFSGCGKSVGDTVTYGCKQKEDIKAVLEGVRQKGYKRFVLWGRSMGAVATLLYSVAYNPTDVILLVLDSAFSTFQEVSKELTNKKTKVPLFLVEVAVEILKGKLKGHSYNPFTIDLIKSGQKCSIPAMFLYSLNDQVIKSEHSNKIIDKYMGTYDRLEITEGHNQSRTKQTLTKVFDVIETHRNQVRRNNFVRSKNGINIVSSSKPKRPGSAINDRRSVNKIKDRLLEGIVTGQGYFPTSSFNKARSWKPNLSSEYYM